MYCFCLRILNNPTKRGPYGGVVGYVDFGGAIDTAIVIVNKYILLQMRAN